MTYSGKLFADKLIDSLINESRFKPSKCQMSIIVIMHNMEQELLFYLMLLIVSIGINLRLL